MSKIEVTFRHETDELHEATIAGLFIEILESYISEKGHFSDYDPSNWYLEAEVVED